MRLKDKPLLFSASIILSVTGSTIAIIGYALAAIFYQRASEFVISVTNITAMDHTSRLYFLAFSLCYLISLYGVILMAKWKRSGFLIYTLSQLIILFIPSIWLDKNSFSATNAIFTLLFVLIYLSFYGKMDKVNQEAKNNS